jgi:transcription initiation factor TFIID subunit TAF12
VYYARESTSLFKAGKFTQELKGSWVTHTDPKKTSTAQRETNDKPITSRQQSQRQQQQETQDRAVNSQQSGIAKGVQQILNPVDVPPTASDAELRGSPAYIEARKAGKNDAQALVIARAASAAGTNNNQGTALPGIRTGPQPIVKDGNPG